jgi:uncharacterized membrane protein YdcZ (DUF606 family)
MSKKRTLATVFTSGFFSMIVFSALNGERPDYSATEWLIFIGGLAVIAVAFIAIEGRFRAKDSDS